MKHFIVVQMFLMLGRPPFFWEGGGGEPSTKFSKGGGGLTGRCRESSRERGDNLFQEQLQFLHKK